MSDTPRTDAAAMLMPMKADAESPSGWCSVVRSTFARDLERENSKLREIRALLDEYEREHLTPRGMLRHLEPTMKSITIETAANGYIARDDFTRKVGMCATGEPFVFETFGALAKWLEHQLEKPKSITEYPAVAGR